MTSHSDFRASRGWLERFLKRKHLSLRRKTTVCQKPPQDFILKLVTFVMMIRSLRIRYRYALDSIFAMDETPCWSNMPGSTTVEQTGARSVGVKTTGHEHSRYTVILSARADGVKLKPFVVFRGKGKRVESDLRSVSGVVIRFSSNGWMNDSLTIDYVRTIVGLLAFHKRLLIWDAYRCHISEAELRRLKLHSAVVPGGCTKFVQVCAGMLLSSLSCVSSMTLGLPSRSFMNLPKVAT